jgi:aerobic carbon-monoxide dehydrogenase medium subunit
LKPPPFEYHAPDTIDEALALLAEHGDEAKPLAGGQSLIPVLNFRLARPAVLVDLNRIAGLGEIAELDGGIGIGALVRQRAAERSALVQQRAPLLAAALPHVAHPQIRTRGTIGGSLAHADPAAELPAVMLALEATFTLRRSTAERRLSAASFFTGLFATALEPDELLVAVAVPATPARGGWAFAEVARRHGDYALLGVAAHVQLDGAGTCSGARLAYVNAGPGPQRARAAEALLAGERPTAALFAAVAEAAAGELKPGTDVHASAAYRRQLARVLTRRVLARAVEQADRAGNARPGVE